MEIARDRCSSSASPGSRSQFDTPAGCQGRSSLHDIGVHAPQETRILRPYLSSWKRLTVRAMKTCGYLVWSKRKHILKRCGKTVSDRNLCAEHLLFVKDATEGPFTRSRKRHPSDVNQTALMKQLYRSHPSKLPSDAGKTVTLTKAQRKDIEKWNTRRLCEIRKANTLTKNRRTSTC